MNKERFGNSIFIVVLLLQLFTILLILKYQASFGTDVVDYPIEESNRCVTIEIGDMYLMTATPESELMPFEDGGEKYSGKFYVNGRNMYLNHDVTDSLFNILETVTFYRYTQENRIISIDNVDYIISEDDYEKICEELRFYEYLQDASELE